MKLRFLNVTIMYANSNTKSSPLYFLLRFTYQSRGRDLETCLFHLCGLYFHLPWRFTMFSFTFTCTLTSLTYFQMYFERAIQQKKTCLTFIALCFHLQWHFTIFLFTFTYTLIALTYFHMYFQLCTVKFRC